MKLLCIGKVAVYKPKKILSIEQIGGLLKKKNAPNTQFLIIKLRNLKFDL